MCRSRFAGTRIGCEPSASTLWQGKPLLTFDTANHLSQLDTTGGADPQRHELSVSLIPET